VLTPCLGGSELTPAPAEPLSARKRGRPPKSKDKEELEDPPFKREKIGSGRGGFSVKGAAAAAARARWDKVRRERAERGEESDEGEKRRPRGAGRKESKVTAETVASESPTQDTDRNGD
jgi:chromatin structure-remodeling complex protein RSC7